MTAILFGTRIRDSLKSVDRSGNRIRIRKDWIVVNGKGKTYEHEKVTIINPKANRKHRFTFKEGPGVKLFSTRSGYGSVLAAA